MAEESKADSRKPLSSDNSGTASQQLGWASNIYKTSADVGIPDDIHPTAMDLALLACSLAKGKDLNGIKEDEFRLLINQAIEIWNTAKEALIANGHSGEQEAFLLWKMTSRTNLVTSQTKRGDLTFDDIVDRQLLPKSRGPGAVISRQGVVKVVDKYFDNLIESFDSAFQEIRWRHQNKTKEYKEKLYLLKNQVLNTGQVSPDFLQLLQQYQRDLSPGRRLYYGAGYIAKIVGNRGEILPKLPLG